MREVPIRLVVLSLTLLAADAGAVFVTNLPVADTSLIEIAPGNNNGGEAWLLAGGIQNDFYRNRALLKFDCSNVPAHAVILSAVVILEVTKHPGDGLANAPYGLYRMLRPWGEGDQLATTNPGQGAPAVPGEATWLNAFHPTNAWAAPGGATGLDFFSFESSFQYIEGLGSYRFESTPELVDDVQGWVRDPESNHGWMLICDEEATRFTARRFGSREDPESPPQLVIEYTVPLVIDRAQRIGNEFILSFVAQPGVTYAVEYCDALTTNSWQPLAYVGAAVHPTRFHVTDTADVPQRFYRLAVQP